MEYRVVVFADILGFKAMVSHISLSEIANKVSRLVERSEVAQVSGSVNFDVGHAHFSDALLLWGPDMSGIDTEEKIKIRKAMMMVASSFLGRSIEDEIPLRMGVAEGSVLIDSDSNIYVGQPIIDAYLLESQQQWVGGAVHPSFGSGELLDSPHHDLVRYEIPLKENSQSQSELAVNWQYCTVGSEDVSVDSLRKKLCTMREQARLDVTPEERNSVLMKYENSLRFLEWASEIYPNRHRQSDAFSVVPSAQLQSRGCCVR